MKMDINFTMSSTELGGGTRVIFEVANRLADRGHKVTITALGGVHEWFPLKVPINYVKPPKWLKIIEPYTKIIKNRGIHYFDVEKIFKSMRLNLDVDFIKPLADATPDCDINVATYCFTAYSVYRSGIGKGFYLIQHYEPLFFKDRYFQLMAKETYYLPLTQLTVSKWLYEKIKIFEGKIANISNAINHDVFYPRTEEKEKSTVLSIFRGSEWKGENEIFSALKKIAKHSKIKLIAVGKRDIIGKLIEKFSPINFEVEIHHNPTDDELARLYSKSQLYVCSSWYEGFGLPPLESMACGTPSVITYSYGVREFAKNNFNSIMVPPKNTKLLSNAIIKAMNNPNLIEQMRKNGLKTSERFQWGNVVDRVEKAFMQAR